MCALLFSEYSSVQVYFFPFCLGWECWVCPFYLLTLPFKSFTLCLFDGKHQPEMVFFFLEDLSNVYSKSSSLAISASPLGFSLVLCKCSFLFSFLRRQYSLLFHCSNTSENQVLYVPWTKRVVSSHKNDWYKEDVIQKFTKFLGMRHMFCIQTQEISNSNIRY